MSFQIRPLAQSDLAEADRIFRLAFGTFLGMPDPATFMGDADMVFTRWRAAPQAVLGAYRDGVLVGSNVLARWGSFGFFGPLTVRPDLWDQGVAKALLTATMALFEQWGVSQTGLFTFAQSPKHVGLYQTQGFWPGHLTAVMAAPVGEGSSGAPAVYSALSAPGKAAALEACRALTDAVYPGLDVSGEILSVDHQGLGETVLVHDGETLVGFAVCHVGAGTEAGSGAAYVKFAAVRPGAGADAAFAAVLSASEALARAKGASRLVAGVNTARLDAYRLMLAVGFRTVLQGVAMQRGDAGFNRPEDFVIDDWR